MLKNLIEIRRYVVLLSLAAVAAGIFFLKLRKAPEITIEEYKKFLKRHFAWAALFTAALTVVLCGMTALVNSSLKPTVYLTLRYEDASSGENPDGTRFNENELISDDVLERVICDGKYNITLDQLRSTLTVGSSYDDMAVSETSPKVATEYHISFTADILNYHVDTVKLIRDIGNAARENLIDRHGENTVIMSGDTADTDEMDYTDAAKHLTMNAEKLKRYISGLQWTEQTFADEDGRTFASVSKKIDDFIDTDVSRYESFVQENGLSKQKSEYLELAEYRNKELDLLRKKYLASYNANLDAIQNYDDSMTSVVLVPTNDKQGSFYMSRTKIGVDYYAEQASKELDSASSVKKQIDSNTYLMDKIKNGDAQKDTYLKADQMLEDLKQEYKELAEGARSVFDNYESQKSGGYIEVQMGNLGADALLGIKKNAVTAVFSCIAVMYCMACIRKEKNYVRR